jgi:cobalt-zinc-cadmium efflux system membrane fusion protein
VNKAGIQVTSVETRDLVQYVVVPGMTDYEPGRYAALTPRTGGTIWRVNKEIGDPVRKGEILALLDAAEVGRTKASFLQNLAESHLRASTLERLEPLKDGIVPQRSLREAEAALRQARFRLFNDQQVLLNFGLPVRLKELEPLPDQQVVRKLRLLGLPESIADQLDAETLTANLLPLVAPFDGVVVERNATVGEVVTMARPKTLFVVADVRELHIDLEVSPNDMSRVHLGQSVLFQPDGGGHEERGRVSHISPEQDATTRRVRVHAEVTNESGRLRPNAYGTSRIAVAERPNALVVPANAVQSAGDIRVVFVRTSEASFEVRPVKPGLQEQNLVEVEGVKEGEQVVTLGSYLLKSELQKDRISADGA